MSNLQFSTNNCIKNKLEKGGFISKENAVWLQGVAIMLMVFHHLFAFPERIHVPYTMVLDFSFFHFETILSYFGRICIGMFAFISGYGMAKVATVKLQYKNPVIHGYKLILHQLLKFYLRFWIVFSVFVPIGFILGVYQFEWAVFLKSLIGINTTYNGEWWYILDYLKFLLLFPFLFWIISLINKLRKVWRIIIYTIIIVFLLVSEFIPIINQHFSLMPAFVIGMIVFASGFFELVFSLLIKTGRLRYIISLFGIALIVLERFFFPISNRLDFIIIPFFCFFMLIFAKSVFFERLLNRSIGFIGKYSTYIWLTHTFFAYYYFQSFTYFPKYSILVFLLCMIMTLIVGIAFETCIQFVKNIINKNKMGFKKQ